MRRRLDQVGELGRVESSELRVGDAQLDRRDVSRERLDARPVEEVGDADGSWRDSARQQAPEQAARVDVDADDAPPAFDAGDLDLVRADEAGAVDVDQLPVEQVLAQKQLAFASFERLQVEACLRERDPAVFDLPDLLCRDEHEPARDLGDGAADRGVVALVQPRDEVFDAAQPAADGVGELAARDEREMEDRGGWGGRAHGAR